MKEPKKYYCGNGERMFEDDKNGHWVEYSKHKAIVKVITECLIELQNFKFRTNDIRKHKH
jgi:hypothetical protein